jgi:hypothetical protein
MSCCRLNFAAADLKTFVLNALVWLGRICVVCDVDGELCTCKG